jgi:hypothetical protein
MVFSSNNCGSREGKDVPQSIIVSQYRLGSSSPLRRNALRHVEIRTGFRLASRRSPGSGALRRFIVHAGGRGLAGYEKTRGGEVLKPRCGAGAPHYGSCRLAEQPLDRKIALSRVVIKREYPAPPRQLGEFFCDSGKRRPRRNADEYPLFFCRAHRI